MSRGCRRRWARSSRARAAASSTTSSCASTSGRRSSRCVPTLTATGKIGAQRSTCRRARALSRQCLAAAALESSLSSGAPPSHTLLLSRAAAPVVLASPVAHAR
eukprot:4901486-Prymnesium_polylepis.1